MWVDPQLTEILMFEYSQKAGLFIVVAQCGFDIPTIALDFATILDFRLVVVVRV